MPLSLFRSAGGHLTPRTTTTATRTTTAPNAHIIAMRCPTALLAAALLAAAAAVAASTSSTPQAVSAVPWAALETRDHHHAAVLAAKVSVGALAVRGVRRTPRGVEKTRFSRAARPDSPLAFCSRPLSLHIPHSPTAAPPLTPGGPPWARRTGRSR